MVITPRDMSLLPPPDRQLGHGDQSVPAPPAGITSGARGVYEVLPDSRGKSTAQTLRVINIYSAKIVTAGRH